MIGTARPTTPEPPQFSDEELIRFVSKHDPHAVDELYRRHSFAALSFARKLVGNGFDAEDIVSEAFLKIIQAIQRGNGPQGPSRYYLLTAVKTCASDHWTAQSRLALMENPGESPQEESGYEWILNERDRELAASAFASLPSRWQSVLWHMDVEREPPRKVAPLLGIEPNAISAVTVRARKGLRQAYLEAYAASAVEESCKPYLPLLAKSVTEGLTPLEDARLQKHQKKCDDCSTALAALVEVRSTMRRSIAPWLLGWSAISFAVHTATPAVGVLSAAGAHSSGMGIGAWAASIGAAACLAAGVGVVGTANRR